MTETPVTADMFADASAPVSPAGPSARAGDDYDRVAHVLFGVPTTMRWIEVETEDETLLDAREFAGHMADTKRETT